MKKTFLYISLFLLLLCGCTKENINKNNSGELERTEEPATEEPATEEPATEEPATEEPATEEPTTKEPTTEIQESDDELSLMELVLLGKSDIYDTEDNQYKKVTELPDYYEEAEFICVDLDGDEILEVILRFSMSSSILHEREGVIYRYPITNRVQYNKDGTISGSSGADYNYLFNIKFEENKMIEEFIYYAIDGKYYSVYEYEGEQIELTDKEIEAIKEQYAEVMIDSYEFNHNNVVTILGNK